MEGGPAQDSGVETEFDMESNDSSMSSVSVGANPAGEYSCYAATNGDSSVLPPTAIGGLSAALAASSSRSLSPPLPPPPAGTPEPTALVTSDEQSETWSLPLRPCITSSEDVSSQPAEDNSSIPEDGYLGDCSSDGGNEKNFPLPPGWRAKSASCPSLPPSPAQATLGGGRLDSSPPGPVTSPQPLTMEDIDPPAGLQFSMLKPTSDQNLGCGYQLVGQRAREGNSSAYRSKMRSSGFRSRYNHHVNGDWSRIKAAIAERKLRIAANTNNGELVEKLAASGVNVKCADEHKRTPLHFAAAKGYTEVVDILLRHGADPNQKDMLGNTALHLAACTNHVPVVTLLLRAGTDITTIDNNGRTPLQLAQAKLKLLQKTSSNNTEMSQVKREVVSVLEMMRAYLARCQPAHHPLQRDAYSQLIDSFSHRLTLHTTPSSLSNDLGNLLDSLGSLSISSLAE